MYHEEAHLRKVRVGSRKPWEVKMTLCIAAGCQDYSKSKYIGVPHVVLAHDYKVETDTASAETEFKSEQLHPLWYGLLAGPIAEARELLSLYKDLLWSEEITHQNCLEKLRVPPAKLRWRLADSHTMATHAMSYGQFLDKGKTQLPEDLFQRTCYEVAAQRIEAELILVGYIGGNFHIFEFKGGEIAQRSHFAAIGSGAQIASSVLYQREHVFFRSITQAAYTVYEAKLLSEIAPGVGHQTSYVLLGPPTGDSTELLRNVCVDAEERALRKAFRRFGPKKLDMRGLPDVFRQA